MLVALLALGVACTGTAFAAGLIGPDDIRANAVDARHVRSGAISSIDVRNLGIRAADLGRASVTSTKIKDGTIRRDDLAGDAIGTAQLASASVTSVQLAPSAVSAAALADGAVSERSLDPRLARVYHMATKVLPGGAERELAVRDGYRYALRCSDDGGGDRTASIVVERPDGSTTWGIGGTVGYQLPLTVPATDSIGAGGMASLAWPLSNTQAAGAMIEVYVGDLSMQQRSHRVSLYLGNTGGGQPVCIAAGTITPFDFD
jgi:hypothetical protein